MRDPVPSSCMPCGEIKKNGKPCTLASGWGTPNPGVGPCKFHASKVRICEKADAEIDGLAKPLRGLTPSQVMLGSMELAAGQLVYCTSRVAELKAHEMWVTTFAGQQAPHPWVQMQTAKMHDCAKFAEMAARAGIAERKQELDEANAMLVAGLVMRVMDEIELTSKQRKALGPAMRKHLEVMAESQAEVVG